MGKNTTRKAIYLALDRRQLNDAILSGTGAEATVFMPGTVYTEGDASIWPGIRPKDTGGGQQDLAQAKRLMAEAGFPDGFGTTYDSRSPSYYESMCRMIKDQLQGALGIDGDIRTWDGPAARELYETASPEGAKGDWALACQGQTATIPHPETTFADIYMKGALRNYSNWTHPVIEQLRQTQQSGLSQSSEGDLFAEAADFLRSFDDNHWITLTWAKFVWPVNQKINGFHPPQTAHYGFKHEDLWVDR